ncbi:MAG: RimJ/RimL family protein N-acetyltransferase, partial [Limisphaerales bacterium]
SPTAAPNISLRRLRREDLDDFQAYRTNPELARYQGWEVQSDTQALTFIEAMHTQPIWQDKQWIQLAICTGDTDKLIGDIGLCLTGDELEVGYTLHHDYHGGGIARYAVAGAMSLALAQTSLKLFLAHTEAANTRSIRLLEALGFLKRDSPKGADSTEWRFALTRDQFDPKPYVGVSLRTFQND